jgi:CheY-like chemotaxis protein
VRARIFEPFFTTKGAQGTGLGLFVSYGIIERHAGRISVKSERGRGTSFHIELPYVEPSSSAIVGCAETAGTTFANAGAFSILVVDDEETVRDTLADMLNALGHEVSTAESGQAALDALEKGGFDLVFTDLSMPEMDGWEVAREVRRRWPTVRVAVVTGYGRDAVHTQADMPADIVIGKPFDFAQVEEVLAQLGS